MGRLTLRKRNIQRTFQRKPTLEGLEFRALLASYTTPEDTPLIVNDPVLAGAEIIVKPAHGGITRTSTGGFGYVPNLKIGRAHV